MNKKKIFLVSLGHLSCDVSGGAVPATLPYLRSSYGMDYQEAGGLMLAYSCLSSLIQPIFGFFADKIQKAWFMPLGIALAGLGLAMMGFMQNYWALFCAIAISGIGAALFHPEGARFANKVSGKSKGIGLSIFSIGGNSGFIIGPLLVMAFVGGFGMQGMLVFGIIGLGMGFVMLTQIIKLASVKTQETNFPQKTESAPKVAEGMAEDPAGAEAAELALAPGTADEPQDSLTKPANNWPEFAKLLVVIVSRSITFVGFKTFIPLYWVSAFGQSNTVGALALVIMSSFGVMFNIIGGLLSDRFGRVRVIRFSYTLMAPAVFAFSLVDNLWLAYAFLPLLGCVIYLPFSSQVVLGQELLSKNIGFASGITLGLATTMGGMFQPVLGWMADNFGLNAAIQCLAASAILGLIFAWLLTGKDNSARS